MGLWGGLVFVSFSVVCLCLLSLFLLFFPVYFRWTMWRKAGAFRMPLLCWCQRRQADCWTPQPTVSSPTPQPRWTAAPIMRTSTTTTSRWHCFVSPIVDSEPWHTKPSGCGWVSVILLFPVYTATLTLVEPLSLGLRADWVVREITLIGDISISRPVLPEVFEITLMCLYLYEHLPRNLTTAATVVVLKCMSLVTSLTGLTRRHRKFTLLLPLTHHLLSRLLSFLFCTDFSKSTCC